MSLNAKTSCLSFLKLFYSFIVMTEWESCSSGRCFVQHFLSGSSVLWCVTQQNVEHSARKALFDPYTAHTALCVCVCTYVFTSFLFSPSDSPFPVRLKPYLSKRKKKKGRGKKWKSVSVADWYLVCRDSWACSLSLPFHSLFFSYTKPIKYATHLKAPEPPAATGSTQKCGSSLWL